MVGQKSIGTKFKIQGFLVKERPPVYQKKYETTGGIMQNSQFHIKLCQKQNQAGVHKSLFTGVLYEQVFISVQMGTMCYRAE